MMESILDRYSVAGFVHVAPGIKVPVETFKTVFEGCVTYDDFMAVDKGILGYKQFFDKCVEDGVLTRST